MNIWIKKLLILCCCTKSQLCGNFEKVLRANKSELQLGTFCCRGKNVPLLAWQCGAPDKTDINANYISIQSIIILLMLSRRAHTKHKQGTQKISKKMNSNYFYSASYIVVFHLQMISKRALRCEEIPCLEETNVDERIIRSICSSIEGEDFLICKL